GWALPFPFAADELGRRATHLAVDRFSARVKVAVETNRLANRKRLERRGCLGAGGDGAQRIADQCARSDEGECESFVHGRYLRGFGWLRKGVRSLFGMPE